MNKAKFMLLGIGVVGVVGSAPAFKAQKFSGNKYCTDMQTQIVLQTRITSRHHQVLGRSCIALL